MDKNKLILAFYGDDFTGSTDALEFMTRAGAAMALFIEPPSAKQLAGYGHLDAIGVAGMTRSMSPAIMEETLRPAFMQLRQLGARHMHYKVCSTFDSSPVTGSIGKAIDVGADVFQSRFVPLLVAAPSLGRYCLFGNLFARLGIGSNGNIYRLDRHPSMSKHPVTPADESDLRLHLGKQTNKKIGLLDILAIDGSKDELRNAVHALIKEQTEIILIDALNEEQLLVIGEILETAAGAGGSLFSVGSSGIEMALGKVWNEKKILQPVTSWPHPGKASPLLVISGSCSPVTAGQIAWALNNGFVEVVLNTNIFSSDDNTIDVKKYTAPVNSLLDNGTSVLVHANGTAGTSARALPAHQLGTALGMIAKEAVSATGIKRIGIAGGDTSSYAARAMEIESVQMIAPIVAGAPLCKARSPYAAMNGTEVNFKGGQVGGEDYFGLLRDGG
jgi:3-oxoisoapionate kinase